MSIGISGRERSFYFFLFCSGKIETIIIYEIKLGQSFELCGEGGRQARVVAIACPGEVSARDC